MTCEVVFSGVARKGIEAARPEMRGRIIERTKLPSTEPHLVDKMAGHRNLYRDRVGAYRIIYHIWDSTQIIHIVRVGPRKDVYKGI